MPLSISQIQVGAIVEDCLEDDGKPKRVRRRGVISKVEYPNDATYSNTTIKAIYVEFEPGKPELVQNRNLALFRAYDSAAAGRLKKQRDNEIGNAVLGDMQTPVVVVDETGVETRQPLSEHTMRKHMGKSPV